MARITKDEYFMMLAHDVAKRSLDPDTQHGCIAVDGFGAILSTGYNGPPRGVDDSKIPLTRPEKYPYMIHSEQNCIANAARIGVSLDGSTIYVTGTPCGVCLNLMHQSGVLKLIMLSSKCTSNKCTKNNMCSRCKGSETYKDNDGLWELLRPHINMKYMEYKI